MSLGFRDSLTGRVVLTPKTIAICQLFKSRSIYSEVRWIRFRSQKLSTGGSLELHPARSDIRFGQLLRVRR